jgi:hypothetical protein
MRDVSTTLLDNSSYRPMLLGHDVEITVKSRSRSRARLLVA